MFLPLSTFLNAPFSPLLPPSVGFLLQVLPKTLRESQDALTGPVESAFSLLLIR